MNAITIVSIAFWLLLGLLYLGVTFQYQEVIIGLCAVIVGILQLAGAVHR